MSLRLAREESRRKAPETIGDHVRERRLELGLTQAETAAKIGVCRDALARWEIRPVVPNVWLMPAVIEFLGYDPQPAATSFRGLIKRTRRTLGLNQPQIASALGVPVSSLNAWERGLYEPDSKRTTVLKDRLVMLSISHGRLAAAVGGSG